MNVTCECGKDYDVPTNLEGKSFRCKGCGKLVHVPYSWRLEELTETIPDDEPVASQASDRVVIPPGHRNLRIKSNKDMLTFSVSRFVKCHPLSVYLPFMILIGCMLGASMAHWPLMVGLFAGFIVAAVLFTEGSAKQARFIQHNGMLCAAVVINTNPYHLAVLINLSHDGSANRMAIGVKRQPLGNMSGGPPKKGDRLLVTATFSGPMNDGEYEDFKIFAVNCGCDDLEQIVQASLKVNPADWIRLETELSKRTIEIGELIKLVD